MVSRKKMKAKIKKYIPKDTIPVVASMILTLLTGWLLYIILKGAT